MAYPDSVATAPVRYIQRSNQAGTRLLQLLGSPLLWVIEEVAMGIYAEQVLPRIINAACGMKVLESVAKPGVRRPSRPGRRDRFRLGAQHPLLPGGGCERGCDRAGGPRVEARRRAPRSIDVPVERSGLDGQSLPFPDDSCDTALSTWTLCTIPDVGRPR